MGVDGTLVFNWYHTSVDEWRRGLPLYLDSVESLEAVFDLGTAWVQ